MVSIQNSAAVLLPVAKPSIITYLHHAYPLAIAQADPRGPAFLAGNYLQLYTRKNSHGTGVNVDFYAYTGYYTHCPFVEKCFETDETLRTFGRDPLEQICAMLDGGAYVEAILDEYWLPNKASYQKTRLLHQNLIYGCNRTERIFFAQGFMQGGQYGNFTISFDSFEKAYTAEGRIRRYVVKEEAAPFDPGQARSYLRDFIDGRCSVGAADPIRRGRPLQERVSPLAVLKANLTGVPPLRKAYGLKTYDVATELVRYYNARSIDIRPWCLFYEHKQNILRLAHYLEHERKVVVQRDLLSELTLIANDFLEVRNTLLESQLLDKKVKISALASNMRRLAHAERSAVSALIDTVQ